MFENIRVHFKNQKNEREGEVRITSIDGQETTRYPDYFGYKLRGATISKGRIRINTFNEITGIRGVYDIPLDLLSKIEIYKEFEGEYKCIYDETNETVH